MKNMLHFFSRPGEAKFRGAANYMFREPVLDPMPADPPARNAPETADGEARMPDDFAGIVSFFEKTVSERKSPYSALLKAAERLQEYIPNEVNRLKAAYALCGDQWPPDVLSFAISSHIADIEHARERARDDRSAHASVQARELRQRLEGVQRESAELRARLETLDDERERLHAALREKEDAADALGRQILAAENQANSMCFVDQAAENIKNDLLARKVILGLP